MKYAMYSQPTCDSPKTTNKVSEICVHRDGTNRIVISTIKTLDDEQMSDIYWVALLMAKTGKRLKDLVGGA